MARHKGIDKRKLAPRGPKKTRAKRAVAKAATVEVGGHSATPATSGAEAESAPIPVGGSASGALPRIKKDTPAHIKRAADRAAALSAGKEPPAVETKGVDPAIVREFSETPEERIAREDKATAAIDAKISPPVEESTERQAIVYRHPGGRPTAYRPEFCELAQKYYESGATDYEVAELLGISDPTLRKYKAERKEFLLACCLGKDSADNAVQAALYQRAKGYDRRTLKPYAFQGQITYAEDTEHIPADVGAAKHWLANRRRDEWRNNAEDTSKQMSASDAALSMIEMARAVAFMLGQGMALQLDAAKVINADPGD